MEHTEKTPKKYMNPYLAGFILGLSLIAAFYFSGRGLGASGAPKTILVKAVSVIAPEHAANTEFYAKYLVDGKATIKDWLVLEIFGVIIGGFISGAIAGRLKLTIEHMPKITARRRIWFALGGGFIVGIGSQLARGCTSGAALTGMVNFSLAGFIALIAIFGTATAVAWFFRKNWLM
jgi:uncharacterized membrane protein YedE/YeeE